MFYKPDFRSRTSVNKTSFSIDFHVIARFRNNLFKAEFLEKFDQTSFPPDAPELSEFPAGEVKSFSGEPACRFPHADLSSGIPCDRQIIFALQNRCRYKHTVCTLD